jgi:hypothetical protein
MTEKNTRAIEMRTRRVLQKLAATAVVYLNPMRA